MSYNCHGFKSAHKFITDELLHGTDIAFLCEHWLRPSELSEVHLALKESDFWVNLKSSMDVENTESLGRPYGGVGFICRKREHFQYKKVHVPNDRIDCIEVLIRDTAKMLVFGVYLPYYNGCSEQVALYSETLLQLQGLLDNCQHPFMVVGDFNASLPFASSLSRNWYKSPPFNKHSLILYDFILDNELSVANFQSQQNVSHTYLSGDNKSYIDHVLTSPTAQPLVSNCRILHDRPDCLSDHFPLITDINLPVVVCHNASAKVATASAPNFPRMNWTKHHLCNRYHQVILEALAQIPVYPPESVSGVEEAQCTVDNLFHRLTDAMHNAVRTVLSETESSFPRRKRNPWWNEDCRIARDRHRFWFFLWKTNGRPRSGHLYECHKFAKKTYRKACKTAVANSTSRVLRQIDKLLMTKNVKQFWNQISKRREYNATMGNEVNMSTLYDHFLRKFSFQAEGSAVVEANDFVNAQLMKPIDSLPDIRMNTEQVSRLIRKLRHGCAPGADGILGEHLRYAASPQLSILLCDLFNLCFRYAVVPKGFTTGVLVPIHKKPHLDPADPKNYRPITISSTLSKLVEMYILRRSDHSFHEMQFGFRDNLGTDIAVSLAHDVISHCVHRGSAVYVCSLDAEGAFDGIPHGILFSRAYSAMPERLWRLMLTWYSRQTVQIKWCHYLSPAIRLVQGTRQGGLTSPYLFNLFYKEIVSLLNDTEAGICVNQNRYNAFCYADDILLTSTTITGLQTLINKANVIIKSQGLRFNPSKTVCCVFGKHPFHSSPNWNIDGTELALEDSIKYLGVVLSNDPTAHAVHRIEASKKAFYALQGAGLHARGLAPTTMSYLWRTAIRPILLYGSHCVHLRQSSLESMQKTQGALIKTCLGLRKSCHHSKLLHALRLPDIGVEVERARLRTLSAAVHADSQARSFYTSIICDKIANRRIDPKGSVNQAAITCAKYSLSFADVVFNKQLPRFNANREEDGIEDSIRQLLAFYSYDNNVLLNLLLRSF